MADIKIINGLEFPQDVYDAALKVRNHIGTLKRKLSKHQIDLSISSSGLLRVGVVSAEESEKPATPASVEAAEEIAKGWRMKHVQNHEALAALEKGKASKKKIEQALNSVSQSAQELEAAERALIKARQAAEKG